MENTWRSLNRFDDPKEGSISRVEVHPSYPEIERVSVYLPGKKRPIRVYYRCARSALSAMPPGSRDLRTWPTLLRAARALYDRRRGRSPSEAPAPWDARPPPYFSTTESEK